MLKEITNGIYTQQDVQSIRGQIRRGLTVHGIFAGITLAAVAVTLAYRIQWATILITLIWGSLAIFMWSMKMSPPIAYSRHLKEIHQGLNRTTRGQVVSVAEALTYRDGVEFYGFIVNIGDQGDPEDDRLFYWDAQKGLPSFAPGMWLEIVSHGNDVIGLRVLEH